MLRVGKNFIPFPPSHSVQDLARQPEHSDLLFGKNSGGMLETPMSVFSLATWLPVKWDNQAGALISYLFGLKSLRDLA